MSLLVANVTQAPPIWVKGDVANARFHYSISRISFVFSEEQTIVVSCDISKPKMHCLEHK